jgi:hypothetical protein
LLTTRGKLSKSRERELIMGTSKCFHVFLFIMCFVFGQREIKVQQQQKDNFAAESEILSSTGDQGVLG